MKRVLLLALCGMISSHLIAQDEAPPHYTVSGGLLGAANFTKFRLPDDGGLEYEGKTGWAAGAWVNFPIGTGFSIEPQLMYSVHRYKAINATPQLLNDGKINYISLPLLLKFHASKMFAITAGPQLDFIQSVEDFGNVAVKDDFNSTSISIFGGLELFPRSRVSVFGRYILGLSNMDERAIHIPGVEYKNRNVQVGLKFRLFGKKTEPLRAAPVETTTPVTPETRTIPDSDGDGINDNLDKCPNVPGLAKYDGCPVPDSDGDGINDELDKCPNQFGTAKYDGCPVPDRDGDGINDDEDMCPDIAGLASNNGCPAVPANVSKPLGMAAQNISFGATNATLTTRSHTSLNQVVRMMNENPGLRIRVEGHTDNVGDDETNMELSEDRAEAVRTYLVNKGISADRIFTEGFGETQPIANNNTSSGRMKNKRIELKVMY